MPEPAETNHGPMLIGTVFNILLFGIMITQVYIYYTSYRRDRLFMKLLVLAVFLVDAVNTVLDFVYVYVSLILHFGDADYLSRTNWQFATDPALTGVISLMVQLFFAWRIYMLTKNWPLVAVVTTFALASGVCAFVTTWETIVIPEFASFQKFRGVVIVWLACAVAADITITTILRKHKTGFKASDMIIDRIIRLTVQTGLITSVVATVDLAVYLTSSSGLHLLFNFALCKLYSNSLMSSLNSRGRWRHASSTFENVFSQEPGQASEHDTTIHFWHDPDAANPRHGKEKRQSILDSVRNGVFVHVESKEMRDIDSPVKDSPVDNGLVIASASIDHGTTTHNEFHKGSPV